MDTGTGTDTHATCCEAKAEQRRLHTHTQTHANTQTLRHTNTQTHRHADTQTHRNTDTQTHRKTDTQTHRHTDTHTYKLTHTHTHSPLSLTQPAAEQRRKQEDAGGGWQGNKKKEKRPQHSKSGLLWEQILISQFVSHVIYITFGCVPTFQKFYLPTRPPLPARRLGEQNQVLVLLHININVCVNVWAIECVEIERV